MSFLLVAIGGMVGAVSRYTVQKALPANPFNISTITVNLAGSFLLGIMIGAKVSGNPYLFAAAGFMGAFTTFSTLNIDLIKLIQGKEYKAAAVYLIITYAGGLLMAAAGLLAGRSV
jgi:fluoride exporter